MIVHFIGYFIQFFPVKIFIETELNSFLSALKFIFDIDDELSIGADVIFRPVNKLFFLLILQKSSTASYAFRDIKGS